MKISLKMYKEDVEPLFKALETMKLYHSQAWFIIDQINNILTQTKCSNKKDIIVYNFDKNLTLSHGIRRVKIHISIEKSIRAKYIIPPPWFGCIHDLDNHKYYLFGLY